MLNLLLVSVIVAVVAAHLETDWTIFKTKYNRNYSYDDNLTRKYIWMENKKYIEQHNKLYSQGLYTYFLDENEFTDMANSDFVAKMAGMKVKVASKSVNDAKEAKNLPPTVDWRIKGYVTPVKNQGPCSSGWAFSAVGSMEGQHFRETGNLVSLSESNLIDCSKRFGNKGCDSGIMSQAFQYVVANKGIDTEASYSYQPKVGQCVFNASSVGATFSSFVSIYPNAESLLMLAVATFGPIACAIDASHPSFQHYSGGIYKPVLCDSANVNQGVLTIGYGTDNSTRYWLVKNSWGTSWGMGGYFKTIRFDNNWCGIASEASYPIV